MGFALSKNPNDLDLSHKIDLNLGDCLFQENPSDLDPSHEMELDL